MSSGLAQLMAVVTQRANEKASAYGIEIQDVRIKRADLPEQNEKPSFAHASGTGNGKPNNTERRAPEAQKIKPEAEKDREIILAEAYRESEELRGGGDAKGLQNHAMPTGRTHTFRIHARWKPIANPQKTRPLFVSPDSEYFRFLKQR